MAGEEKDCARIVSIIINIVIIVIIIIASIIIPIVINIVNNTIVVIVIQSQKMAFTQSQVHHALRNNPKILKNYLIYH